MAALQKLPSTTTAVQNVFPAGLRVLVVDNDVKNLRSLETMLWRCMYRVTTCSQATVALELLREKRCHFDVVLSDIHMPDMDGFKLLELLGLEMDLPVIMMSDDERTSLVLRGIKHGACDYLIKPIREEELRKIWQHVVRKRLNGNKEHEHSGSFDYNDWHKQAIDDTEYASSVNEGMLKSQKKRRDVKEEDDDELENDDQTASKRPRVVWSVELHQQFVSAVNQLGIDKAVPKRILELMNMPGLTRENVASHLQKFRLYLKRVSGSVTQQQGGIPNSFSGHLEQSWNVIAASGPQTLASMHAELLGEPTTMNQQQTLLQGQLLGSKCIAMDHGVAPMMRCQPKKNPQPIIAIDGDHSGFGSWPASSNLGAQNGSMLMGTLQKQQQQQQHRKQHILSEPINVHPACLVVPSQSSAIFHSPASVNQPNGFNSNYSFGADGNLKLTGVFSGYSSISPSISLCSVDVENVVDQQVQKSIPTFVAGAFIPNMTDMQSSYNGQMIDEGMLRNLGFVGKGTSIPSCFALYEPESATGNLNEVKNYGGDSERKLKQELGVDLIENLEWET